MTDTSGPNTNVPTPFRPNRATRRATDRAARRMPCECPIGKHWSCDYPQTKCACPLHEVIR